MTLLKMHTRYKKNSGRKFQLENTGAIISFNSRNETVTQKSKMTKNKSKKKT
jgi:hypothetical protein